MANGDEEEAMLELSIGGIFGKQKKLKQNASEKGNRIGDLNVNMNQWNELNGLMDLKGEIGVRRRELRRKREEKMGSCGSVTGPFVENKEWLETQVVRRNAEPICKKEKIGLVDDDVNCGFKAYNGKLKLKDGGEDEVDGGGRCCCKMNLKGCGSFDGQCSSHQGVVTDDSRSNSSNSQLDQQPASTSTTTIEPLDPSKQTTKISATESANPEPSCQQQASLLARMPCVSTTGNGPNGKTISGFLYRYTKNEVSIVCVCHGRSFSPAGFVEHAGGVDIVHPLKHITIVPAAFAS